MYRRRGRFAGELDFTAITLPSKVADAHFIQVIIVLAVVKHDLACSILRPVGLLSVKSDSPQKLRN